MESAELQMAYKLIEDVGFSPLVTGDAKRLQAVMFVYLWVFIWESEV